MLDNEDEAYTYNFVVSLFPISWLLFLKNFKLSLTFLGVFARIERDNDNLTKLACLLDLSFLGLFLSS